MARNVTLLEMLDRLRAEARHALQPAAGTDVEHRLRNKLRRVQEELYDQHDWPHMRVDRRVSLQAGERFYDLPADLNYDRLEEVSAWYGGTARPLDRGISQADYSVHNSADGARSDPVYKWDVKWTGVSEQLEVWPVPSSDEWTIEFRGIRALRPLINDNDVCDLDDTLIILAAASEILGAQGARDAAAVFGRAQDRLRVLKARSRSAPQITDLVSGRNIDVRGVDKRMVVVRTT